MKSKGALSTNKDRTILSCLTSIISYVIEYVTEYVIEYVTEHSMQEVYAKEKQITGM